MQLKDKVALVTGAGRGIGREVALYLAEQGASVALNDLEQGEGARSAAEQICRSGRQAIVCLGDVRRIADIDGVIAAVVEQFGGIDILVNNAGVDSRRHFFDVTEEFWNDMLGVNLKAVFFCTQAAAREMRKSGKGAIVNISSVHGQATLPDLAAYAAAKGGVNALTRQMALDLAPFGITVNAVAPGCVYVEKCTFDPAERGRQIPLGRVGTPRDIAAVIAFLASAPARWVTGEVITVDGGTTARLALGREGFA